jgi:hypothetical protein
MPAKTYHHQSRRVRQTERSVPGPRALEPILQIPTASGCHTGTGHLSVNG